MKTVMELYGETAIGAVSVILIMGLIGVLFLGNGRLGTAVRQETALGTEVVDEAVMEEYDNELEPTAKLQLDDKWITGEMVDLQDAIQVAADSYELHLMRVTKVDTGENAIQTGQCVLSDSTKEASICIKEPGVYSLEVLIDSTKKYKKQFDIVVFEEG